MVSIARLTGWGCLALFANGAAGWGVRPRHLMSKSPSMCISNAGDLRTCFSGWGFTSHQIDHIFQEFPGIFHRSLEDEIRPRMQQIHHLVEAGVFEERHALELVAEQPWWLQRRFAVLFENDHYLVIDKPFDVRMHTPEHRAPGECTVEDWFRKTYPDLLKMRNCHQLDFATSGVLVLAKTKRAAAQACALWRDREVTKEYAALVEGHVPFESTHAIEVPIAPGPPGCFHMQACPSMDSPGAKTATTLLDVVARGHLRLPGPWNGRPVSHVRLQPITGRRHQLRLHMAQLGNPIIGDATYGDSMLAQSSYRTFLHARRLVLPLPQPTGTLDLEAPIPFPEVFVAEERHDMDNWI